MDFFTIVCIIAVLTLVTLAYKNYTLLQKVDPTDGDDVLSKLTFLNDTNKRRVNCIKDTYFCGTDSDCMDICDTGSVLFKCDETTKACTPLKDSEVDPETDKRKCNAQHGFLNVLSADATTGLNWSCINTLPQIFDNRDNKHTSVCYDGDFPVNVEDHYPTADDCVCHGEQNVLCVRNFDGTTPRCVHRDDIKFLPSFRPVRKM